MVYVKLFDNKWFITRGEPLHKVLTLVYGFPLNTRHTPISTSLPPPPSLPPHVYFYFASIFNVIYVQRSCLLLRYFYLAAKMLRNMGENVSGFMKDVSFHTTRRALRWRLLRHLSHTCGILTEEVETIEYVRLLEALFPTGCYTIEFQRAWQRLLSGELPAWTWDGWGGSLTLPGSSSASHQVRLYFIK